MKGWVAILALIMFIPSTPVLSDAIRRASDIAPLELCIRPWVSIQFDDAAPFVLSLDGNTATAAKNFTAACNCPATITGTFTSPATPDLVAWEWQFQDGTQRIALPRMGSYHGSVTLQATGNPADIPTALHGPGTFILHITPTL